MIMNKQISTILAVSIIVFLSAAVGTFSWAASQSVGALCDVSYNYGAALKNNNNIVGNDRDEHGCIGSAGYIWCEEKKKCLRSWEEKCEAD